MNAALFALLLVQPAQPPHGVNDSILGTEEEFRVAGPARICISRTSIDLRAGESASLYYSGIHIGTIRVAGSWGPYLVSEGNWAEGRNIRLEEDWRGRTISRGGPHRRPTYFIYAPRSDGSGEDPLVKVSGDALGRSHDSDILNRILVHPDAPGGCRRRFNYGWDVIFGEEPLETRD